ncbi:MAG: hypothetical protein KAT16_11310, partial [Candidatus Heimdallarchaeota archaeon]|nr:hypothetical protein [Candidatus Heimdallarchaeota archaeon]
IILGLITPHNNVISLYISEISSDSPVPPVILEYIDKFDWKVTVGDEKAFVMAKYNKDGEKDSYVLEGTDKAGQNATINVSAGTTFVVTITYLNPINDSFYGAHYPRGSIIYNDVMITEDIDLRNLVRPTYVNQTYWEVLTDNQDEGNDVIYRMIGDNLIEQEYHVTEDHTSIHRWNWKTGWTSSLYQSDGNSTHLDSEVEILDKDSFHASNPIPDLEWSGLLIILITISLTIRKRKKEE